MTIPSISSGQLIDQNLLSNIITTLNSISSSQYNANSVITDTSSNIVSSAQNGEWVVASGVHKPTIPKISANAKNTFGPFTVSFPNNFAFATPPVVTATLSVLNSEGSLLDQLISTIIVSSITTTSFTYTIVFLGGSSEISKTDCSIMYNAIGNLRRS